MNALVSIITPAHNSEKYISETVISVLTQTYRNWEMLITDDGSTDDTWALISRFAEKDGRIKCLRHKECRGAGPARNTSLAHAKGEYVAFLDSDDIWHPEKLEKQLRFMQSQNSDFSYTAYEVVDEAADNVLSVVPAKPFIDYASLLSDTSIGCLTVMLRAKAYREINMPDLPCRQPLVLWLRCLRERGAARGLPETLASYRARRGSISSNKLRAAKYVWIVYRDYEGLSLIKSCHFFIKYAVNGFLRNLSVTR